MRGGQAVRNAALLLLSLVLSLGMAEVAVRLFVPVRDVGPSFTVHDPVLGKRLKRNFSAQRVTPEFNMRLSTNSLGFRGPEPHGAQRRPLIFLGDSFTLGYGVSDGEEYPARIALELQHRHGAAAPPVVNAGIGDSGNGFWVKFLRGEAVALQPRLVVMQVLDNDFADNVNEKLFVLGAGDSLEEPPVPAPGTLRKLQTALDAFPGLTYSYLIGMLRQVRLPRGEAQSTPGAAVQFDDSAERLTLRIIEEAVRTCEARGWRVLGVLVGLSDARTKTLQKLFARHGIPNVVLPGKHERPDLYYRIDGHWHAAGHEYAARRVTDALEALGVVGL
jgi:hypothetical protein